MRAVTVATVVDDRPPYRDEVVVLFASLEAFGGVLRRARRRAYVVNGVCARTEQRLRGLGVEVRVVAAVEPRFRLANKLAMFDAEASEDTELLVALDTDTVVAGDFSAYLDTGVIQAKPPDGDGLTLDMWAELFDHFGLELPAERHPTSLVDGWTHAYFNTGVIMAPGDVLRALHERWLHFIRAILDARGVLGGLVEHFDGRVPQRDGAMSDDLRHLYFAEQWAFSLARHELAAPYAVLPLALNFPTIYTDDQYPGAYIRERFLPHAMRPLILHHHHQFADGLRPTGYQTPDAIIARVNDALFGATRTAPATAGAPDLVSS